MENKRVENYTRNPYYEQVVSVGLTLLNIPEKVVDGLARQDSA